MGIELLLVAVICTALGGVPGLLTGRRAPLGEYIATSLHLLAALIGFTALIIQLSDGGTSQIDFAWSLPLGRFSVGIDDLSAIFLVPMLLIPALGSIYGLEYWKQSDHPGNAQKLRLCWGLLAAGMMMVVLARDAVLLLISWEVMALAGFILVATEDGKPEVRRAAWVYLIAAHVGALCLFAFFATLRYVNGSWALWPTMSGPIPTWAINTLFITGIVGFGLKAGLMPLHVWLPGAHANAPSHVSAILSGVLLKAGVYGILRVAGTIEHPPIWWGGTLIAVGAVSGILGIAFAVAQHDFKRTLAYSSIENIGIITIGIGLALVGRTLGHPAWVVLGLCGALLHVLNHSLFKPLLFMGAGSLLHATRTRQMDLLGGLGKSMPRTFALFIIGAIAICGLPPLNGFVSEFLIYAGLFRVAADGGARVGMWASLAAPALAMIGALAVSTFVKLIGAVFLGSPRSHRAEHGHDPQDAMLAPMAFLATCCIIVGIFPFLLIHPIQRAVGVWDPAVASSSTTISSLVPMQWFTFAGVMLAVLAVAGFYAMNLMMQKRAKPRAGTWDCGYAAPTSRIQYTGSSFGQMLTDLFGWALWPKKFFTGLRGVFARPSDFSSDVADPVLDRGLAPAFSITERVMSLARPLHRGSVQAYLVYILAMLLLMLLVAAW
jgi:hydrogenase-4 component B